MKMFFFLLLFLLSTHKAFTQMNSEDIQKIIDEIKLKYAPDKRTAVYDVKYSVDNEQITLVGETSIPEAKKELLGSFMNQNVIDKIELLPSKELSDRIFGIANLSVSDVRAKPDHASELTTQVLLGSTLKILKYSSGWYLVQCEDEYIGWMEDDGLARVDKNEFDSWRASDKVIVTAPFSFTYSESTSTSSIISDVVVGDLLKFISKDRGFVKVAYPDGRSAFINNSGVQDYESWLNSREQSFQAISKTAHSMIGFPYVWGGTSIKGVDCSGFTKLVFKLNGIELPRDASQQVYVGELVDTQNGFDNLLPGDLLFFGSRKDQNSGKERITHVAIYIGNLEFIHSSGRVRINSFDKEKSNFAEGRLKSFVRAKRILTSLGKNGVELTKNLIKRK